ncbi:RNA polymerase sigma factor [Streptomyces sp. H10-C2]|uniref:RNA polymerase sigma factor n=1 Tax=unclassified Streptomyces TaxID=2593676 RepID=UPI0024BACF4D|nr:MULTISPECIES: RNA polymerase sigma factor [unclassified Streptomyces]MDJ0341894.1 RNA polymerase sigma factor [Streptomyces sp. PH10-H1]MDJ0370352.1 RNA polymerase sigma factor [Streptomyces sp. H10-C2]
MDELLTILTPYVGRICGPVALEDGDDAAQEALISVFRNIRQLDSPAALFGWVRVIAVREAVRLARRRQRTVVTEPTELSELPAVGEPELAQDIGDVLRHLSPEHRAVLMLRHVEGLDEQEVAKVLAVPLGTVRSRLFRARRSFRDAWGGAGR